MFFQQLNIYLLLQLQFKFSDANEKQQTQINVTIMDFLMIFFPFLDLIFLLDEINKIKRIENVETKSDKKCGVHGKMIHSKVSAFVYTSIVYIVL